MVTLELLGRNIGPLHFETERVAETALRASWFWPTSLRFPGTWRIFFFTGNSKLTPDRLALHWNGQSNTLWTLTFDLLGRNLAPLLSKIERVAEYVLRESWFWLTSTRFPGISGIYSSPGNTKLTLDGLGLQWNGHGIFFWKLTLELLGVKIAPLYFKTERVAETALRASLFWQTLSGFFGTYGIFSSPWDSKLTLDGFAPKWNWHRKTFWTLTFELLGRNIAPLHFKTERLAKTALRPGDFEKLRLNFPEFGGYFPLPGSLN